MLPGITSPTQNPTQNRVNNNQWNIDDDTMSIISITSNHKEKIKRGHKNKINSLSNKLQRMCKNGATEVKRVLCMKLIPLLAMANKEQNPKEFQKDVLSCILSMDIKDLRRMEKDNYMLTRVIEEAKIIAREKAEKRKDEQKEQEENENGTNIVEDEQKVREITVNGRDVTMSVAPSDIGTIVCFDYEKPDAYSDVLNPDGTVKEEFYKFTPTNDSWDCKAGRPKGNFRRTDHMTGLYDKYGHCSAIISRNNIGRITFYKTEKAVIDLGAPMGSELRAKGGYGYMRKQKYSADGQGHRGENLSLIDDPTHIDELFFKWDRFSNTNLYATALAGLEKHNKSGCRGLILRLDLRICDNDPNEQIFLYDEIIKCIDDFKTGGKKQEKQCINIQRVDGKPVMLYTQCGYVTAYGMNPNSGIHCNATKAPCAIGCWYPKCYEKVVGKSWFQDGTHVRPFHGRHMFKVDECLAEKGKRRYYWR